MTKVVGMEEGRKSGKPDPLPKNPTLLSVQYSNKGTIDGQEDFERRIKAL
jgi:hypothetical protein